MPGSGFQNDIVFANNGDFSNAAIPAAANGLRLDQQVWMGRTHDNNVHVVTLTAGAGITLTPTDTTLTIAASGGSTAVDSFAMQTGTSPVVPDGTGLVTFNGSRVLAGTNPVRTNGTAANTMQLEVQISQALDATDATKIGLSNFNSAQFTVDANGFVSLAGALPPSGVTELFDDFIFNASGNQTVAAARCFPFFLDWNTSTGSWLKAQVANHPGVFSYTSTSASGTAYIVSATGSSTTGITPGLYKITIEYLFNFSVLSSANPTYTVFLGMWDGSGADPNSPGVDGIWMEYTSTANSGNWVMKTSTAGSGGSVTTANSTTAASTGWHRYKIVVNAAASSVSFFIDNVELTNSPMTLTIPTATQLNMEVSMTSQSGTNQKIVQCDYFYLKTEYTR